MQELTSEKMETDMCVYVDNSVDLVDFSCFSTKKATSVSNLSTEKKCKNRFMVLNQSMTDITERSAFDIGLPIVHFSGRWNVEL